MCTVPGSSFTESRHRLTLVRHYLEAGGWESSPPIWKEITPQVTRGRAGGIHRKRPGGRHFGGGIFLAEQGGVYVEYDCGRLPEPLFVADDDLTSVLMNVLENAVEGCGRLADPGERWLFSGCVWRRETLRWSAAIPPRLERRTVPASGTGRARLRPFHSAGHCPALRWGS